MAYSRNPTCFIAMAFGHEDTNAFYENQVLPVLKRHKIKAVIINRRQNNDDLNIQIIDQLEKADFCIADLTYTRPSVYFEAGFAQRMIPVIYTVRKDHLDNGQPDDRRVHFDLQMKPLITWNSPTDDSFATRLEARIKSTFLRDWAKNQTINEKYEIEERRFKALPANDRLECIRHDAILAFQKLGFGHWSVHRNISMNYWSSYPKSSILSGKVNFAYGHKTVKDKFYLVSIQSFSSPTKNELSDLEQVMLGFLPNAAEIAAGNIVTSFYLTALILNLNNVSSSRIESSLPDVIPLEPAQRYYHEAHVLNGLFRVEFLFLSGIQSRLHLKDLLRNQVGNDYIN